MAVAAGLAGLVLTVLLFRAPAPAPARPRTARPSLELGPTKGTAGDPLFAEESSLRDPTPLFLPTEWNSEQKEVVLRAPDSIFPPYGAKPMFSDARLRLDLPPAIAVPASPADALSDNPPGHPFLGLGRVDHVILPLLPRGAFVAIVAADSGMRVFSQELTDVPPDLADAPPEGGAWQFMAAVDPAGLVGPLVPTVRSGTSADRYFLDYLREKLRIGERLPPGFYRISIGP